MIKKAGVPQVLGSLLFIIYIKDMPNDIASNIKLHADDAEPSTLLHTPIPYLPIPIPDLYHSA